MTRRYGKVTVTGWIEQNTAETYVAVGRTGVSPLVARIYEDNAAVNAGASVVVEFLPEPVVFKDGDVLRYGNDWTYLRSGGRWVYVGPMDPSRVSTSTGTDEDLARDLMHGVAVRLVPEGTADEALRTGTCDPQD